MLAPVTWSSQKININLLTFLEILEVKVQIDIQILPKEFEQLILLGLCDVYNLF